MSVRVRIFLLGRETDNRDAAELAREQAARIEALEQRLQARVVDLEAMARCERVGRDARAR